MLTVELFLQKLRASQSKVKSSFNTQKGKNFSVHDVEDVALLIITRTYSA